MHLSVKKLLFAIVCIVALAAIAGCSIIDNEAADSDSQNCINCHTSKEKLAADLKANPLPFEVISAESSGEG